MIIMRKIYEIKFSKMTLTKINWYRLELREDILGGRGVGKGGVGERWVFLQLTKMSVGSSSFLSTASRGLAHSPRE